MDTEFTDRLNELLKAGRLADEEDKKLVDNMQHLTQNHDFQMYAKQVLAPRIEQFGAMLLEPSTNVDGLVRSEFIKGALYGLCLARDLPSVILTATRKGETSDE